MLWVIYFKSWTSRFKCCKSYHKIVSWCQTEVKSVNYLPNNCHQAYSVCLNTGNCGLCATNLCMEIVLKPLNIPLNKWAFILPVKKWIAQMPLGSLAKTEHFRKSLGPYPHPHYGCHCSCSSHSVIPRLKRSTLRKIALSNAIFSLSTSTGGKPRGLQ